MIGLTIRPAEEADRERVIEIALAAWYPVTRMHRWQAEFGPLAGLTWQDRHRSDLNRYFDEAVERVLVAESDGRVVRFVTYNLDRTFGVGEIDHNAVDPDYQRVGIATAMYIAVLDIFRQAGMTHARVRTGLDEDHAAARQAYEKIGFRPTSQQVVYGMKL